MIVNEKRGERYGWQAKAGECHESLGFGGLPFIR